MLSGIWFLSGYLENNVPRMKREVRYDICKEISRNEGIL